MAKEKRETPLNWPLRLLQWFCPPQLYEEIEGDLLQKFNGDLKKLGIGKAKRRLALNVIQFFRPEILLRSEFTFTINQNFMFRNHTKVVMRQVFRNKTFSVINIGGLTLGLTACLLIAQFVRFEWSFEDFNPTADRVYRVNLYNTQNGVFKNISPETVSGLSYSIRESLPGIKSTARLSGRTSGVVSTRDHNIEDKEDNLVYADPSIIELLALDLIDGDKRNVLKGPGSIIISESIARKYFGDVHVAGRILDIGFNNGSIEKKSYEIQGVFRDIPANSHQHFHFILTPENEQAWNENWAWSNVSTYVRLPENSNPEDLGGGLSKIVDAHHVDGKGDRYLLEPIKEIRLHALDGSGRASLVNFFILLGIVVLLLAWFNYINLSLARFVERMKEVGVRKLIGASRAQLVFYFLVESFLFNLFSLIAAIVLFLLCWPVVAGSLQQPIPVTLFSEQWMLACLFAFMSASTLCSGLYPALFLSSFKPLQSLKGKILNFTDRSSARKVIIVSQFSVSIILISGVLAIQQQIEFMRSQDLGISIDQTLIIEEPLLTDATTVEKYKTFKNEIGRLPTVSGITYASTFSGSEIDWHRTDITLGEENAGIRYNSRIIAVGTEFLDVFKLPLVFGRNFNPDFEGDNKAMLISEEASRMFGFSTHEALGKLIFMGSRRFEVIGVVKDYHYRSLQNEIQPVLYIQGYPRNPKYAIKISNQGIAETIAAIELKWKRTYAGNIFKYYFLDQYFDQQYTAERQLGGIVTGMAVLTIFISCSGLFALALYSVNRRTKEIGIRKVLGASVKNVVLLLTGDFIKLVLIGGLLAIPLSYQGIRVWLERFAYKMTVNAGLFIIPIVAVFLLALITVSFQTVAAAKKNPADSMKCE